MKYCCRQFKYCVKENYIVRLPHLVDLDSGEHGFFWHLIFNRENDAPMTFIPEFCPFCGKVVKEIT